MIGVENSGFSYVSGKYQNRKATKVSEKTRISTKHTDANQVLTFISRGLFSLLECPLLNSLLNVSIFIKQEIEISYRIYLIFNQR